MTLASSSITLAKVNDGAKGATGNGIKSVTVTYGVSSSASTQPTSWQNTVPAVSEGQYLWTRTVTDYTSDSVADTVTYTYAKQGKTGGTGATGATGNGIRSVTNHYLATSASNGVTTSTSGWSTSVQTMTEANRYLWNYETIAYTNGTSVNSTPCVIGVYGSKGNPGSPGTSVTVSSILYQAGTSATTAPTGTWSNNPVSVAQGQFLWTKTTFSDGKVAYGVARQGTDGKPGGTGATGRGISSISHYYATTATQSAPSASSITSTTIPAMSASKKYLWRKTVITYTDSTNSHSVELIAVYGDTGDSASIKDFDLDLSAKAFSVSPRGYTRTAETIVATCTLIHVAANTVTITWSSTSSQVTLTPSSDKTTCTISVAARVALLPFRISCAVTGIGLTKTVSVDVQPETGNAYSPIYLGTNWDTSKSWSNSNDPIFSGDYYLDTSTNTPMIASVASNGTITYSAMQTGNPNTALIMGNVLSDILAQGSGVQSTCVAVNAYFGAIAAKTGFIKSLRSQVIQSTNYTYEGMDEGKPETDASWPVSGWELDGPNNVIKSVGLRSAGGEFHDVNITSGNITITDSDMNTILATVKDDAPSKLSGSVTADYYLVDEVVASSGMAENAETSIACRYDGASYPIAVRATKEINYSFYYSNAYIDTTKEYESVTVVLNDTKKDVVIYAGHINNSERRIKLVQLFLTSPSGTITTLYHDIDGASGSKTFSVGTLPIGTSIEAIFGCYVVGQGGYRQGPLLEGMFTVTASGNTYSAGNLYLLDSSFNIAVTLPLSSYLSHTSHPLVVGSASSSAKYSMVSDFIATLSVGNFQIDQSKTMTYSDGIYGSITQLATVTVTNNSITMTRSGASPISYYSGGVIVGSPSLSVYAVTRLKGATVYNLNRADENSLVGTAPKPFANVWTQNLNNVPVTDSNNQSLAVSGASSIVGALNQINRDLDDIGTIVTNTYGTGIKLRSGLIVNFGYGFYNSQTAQVTYPIPFSTYGIPVANTYGVNKSGGWIPKIKSFSVAGFTYYKGFDDEKVVWIAIGY